MKKIFAMFMAALMVCSVSYAQNVKSTKGVISERKAMAKLSSSELNKKASTAAAKEALKLKREGWKVASGQLPLEKQLDKSCKMYYEYEESGLPKYIISDGISTGATYDEAKKKAIEQAKTNMAGMIQSEVTSIVENTVAKDQLSPVQAKSITSAVSSSKNVITEKLGKAVVVTECYKTLPNKAYQVRVSLASSAKTALDDSKAIIKSQVKDNSVQFKEQLDAIWEKNGL